MNSIRLLSFIAVFSLAQSNWGVAQSTGLLETPAPTISDSLRLARRWLVDQQLPEGAFPADGALTHTIGTTSLATLALLRTEFGGERDDATRKALEYLRTLPDDRFFRAHEISLTLIALVTANNEQDTDRVKSLAEKLSRMQPNVADADDLTATQMALLGLRAASCRQGVPDNIWQDTAAAWLRLQNPDGGWSDMVGPQSHWPLGKSHSSPTLTGAASLSMCRRMLTLADRQVLDRTSPSELSTRLLQAERRASNWLTMHVAQSEQDQTVDQSILYHLYGLERSIRHQGEHFQGENRWRHHAADQLLRKQVNTVRMTYWTGNNNVIATSFAMILLADLVAPPLMSRLDLDTLSGRSSDGVRDDVWRLAHFVAREKKWPLLLNCGEWSFGDEPWNAQAKRAPLLVIRGREIPPLAAGDLQELTNFVHAGGTIAAFAGGDVPTFRTGLQTLLQKVTSQKETIFIPLPAEHPVHRMMFDRSKNFPAIEGFDSGCRTVAFYVPEDLSVLWSSPGTSSGQPPESLAGTGRRAAEVGANLLTYALGDLPHHPYAVPQLVQERPDPPVPPSRQMELAVIQHSTADLVASTSLQTVIRAANKIGGLQIASKPRIHSLDDPDLYESPILFLHGRRALALTASEEAGLHRHLENGGVLFADACCSSPDFDASFRQVMQRLFPGSPLTKIPLDDPLYSSGTGFDLTGLQSLTETRATPESPGIARPGFLEGVRLDGHLAVIYSSKDLSCALEPGPVSHCRDYSPTDALQIVLNMIRGSLL